MSVWGYSFHTLHISGWGLASKGCQLGVQCRNAVAHVEISWRQSVPVVCYSSLAWRAPFSNHNVSGMTTTFKYRSTGSKTAAIQQHVERGPPLSPTDFGGVERVWDFNIDDAMNMVRWLQTGSCNLNVVCVYSDSDRSLSHLRKDVCASKVLSFTASNFIEGQC